MDLYYRPTCADGLSAKTPWGCRTHEDPKYPLLC